MTHRLCSIVLACACAPALAAPAHTHEFPQEREVIAQVGRDRVDLLVTYTETNRARIDVTMARFDLDRDGALTGPEAILAGQSWLPYALAGLTFEVVGEKPAMQPPSIKFKRTDAGEVKMAVLMSYEVPALAPEATRTLRVRLHDDPHTLPLTAQAQAVDGLRLRDIAGHTIGPTRRTKAYPLQHGADVTFTYVAPEQFDQTDE